MLPTLQAGSVQTCVTSPPYFGLRDYGTGRWEGGDADCDHRSPTMREGFGFIGIEIDPEYCEIARIRIHADAPLFAEIAA